MADQAITLSPGTLVLAGVVVFTAVALFGCLTGAGDAGPFDGSGDGGCDGGGD